MDVQVFLSYTLIFIFAVAGRLGGLVVVVNI